MSLASFNLDDAPGSRLLAAALHTRLACPSGYDRHDGGRRGRRLEAERRQLPSCGAPVLDIESQSKSGPGVSANLLVALSGEHVSDVGFQHPVCVCCTRRHPVFGHMQGRVVDRLRQRSSPLGIAARSPENPLLLRRHRAECVPLRASGPPAPNPSVRAARRERRSDPRRLRWSAGTCRGYSYGARHSWENALCSSGTTAKGRRAGSRI
jgi:hypothetical protein